MFIFIAQSFIITVFSPLAAYELPPRNYFWHNAQGA